MTLATLKFSAETASLMASFGVDATALTGGTLDRLLTLSTASHGRALWFGIIFTAITQSSSLVSLLTISFVSAGLVTLAGGLGIITALTQPTPAALSVEIQPIGRGTISAFNGSCGSPWSRLAAS